MATIIDNPAISILDRLINQVETSLHISHTSTAASQSSFLPSHTTDVAWRPIVPLGHTVYSWVGENDSPVEVNSTPAPEPLQPLHSTQSTTQPKEQPKQSAEQAKPAGEAKKKEKKPAAKRPEPAPVSDQPAISRIDIRVGQVVKASRHPDAEKLYVEEIDVGEDKPRQVISGLVPFIDIDTFSKARLCVICNLKPSKLRGVESFGMVLAASNSDHTQVELIQPPADAPVGTRLTLSNLDLTSFTPDAIVDPKKKGNAWEQIKEGLKTDAEGRATFNGDVFRTQHGECRAPTLKNATIA